MSNISYNNLILLQFLGDSKPLSWVMHFWPVLLAAFISALAATALCKKIAIKFGIVDRPDDLVKTHKEPIAYLGGIGIFIGLLVGTMIGQTFILKEKYGIIELNWLLGMLAGGAVACVVGLADDIFDLKPKYKMGGQLIAAILLIIAGIIPNLDRITAPFGFIIPEFLAIPLSYLIVIFFVLGATNSLNLLDGLDGLCAGVTTIITIAMFLLSIYLATWGYSPEGDPVRIIICLALIGGVCGFLPFNRYPAKIFMGDAGSMLLGFIIAALMISFAEGVARWCLASIVVFGLPILDTAVALIRRLLNKRPLFVSDRGHIYDQMIDRGIPLNKTVAICYALAGIYALIGLIMSWIRTRYAIIVYLAVSTISAVVVWKKGYLKMEGLRGAIKVEKNPTKQQ